MAIYLFILKFIRMCNFKQDNRTGTIPRIIIFIQTTLLDVKSNKQKAVEFDKVTSYV